MSNATIKANTNESHNGDVETPKTGKKKKEIPLFDSPAT